MAMASKQLCSPIFAIGMAILISACSEPGTTRAAETAQPAAQANKGEPLEAYRAELLDLAFDTAVTYPVNPHIKDRSRAQQRVVEAALALDQPDLALEYLEDIRNWRRGLMYARLARYLSAQPNPPVRKIEALLGLAEAHGRDPLQEWRTGRVYGAIAEARAILGQVRKTQEALDEADDIAVPMDASRAVAAATEADEFQKSLEQFDQIGDSGEYELQKAAIFGYVMLYDQFYDNADRRELLTERVEAKGQALPPVIRFQALIRMGNVALDHEDQQRALALAEQAEQLKDEYRWPLDFDMPMEADLLKLRIRAGQEQSAAKQLVEALEIYEQKREQVQSFQRAAILRPLAEVHALLDDEAAALNAYRRVVEEGAVNPNRRPRTDDLVDTAVSMARYEVEPDDDLWATMRDIYRGLNDK